MQVLGRYTSKNNPMGLGIYTVPYFNLHARKNIKKACGWGCGSKAYSTLIGKEIPYRNSSNSVPDHIMIKLLRKEGCTVIPLTFKGITDHKCTFYNVLREDHVILVSQMVVRQEATWAILHKKKYWHGTEVNQHPLEFLCRPIITAYVVYHKKWLSKPGVVNEEHL